MHHYKSLWGIALLGMVLAGVAVLYPPAEAQYSAADQSAFLAISNEVNEHVHSVSLSRTHVEQLLRTLGAKDQVTLQSSQEFNNAVSGNALHSHSIAMDPVQLGVLQATGTVDVESGEAAGHKHLFRFVMKEDCTVIFQSLVFVYPPMCCPYGGQCRFPYPYPGTCKTPGACPEPCLTCPTPFPPPTPCPGCPPVPSPSVSVTPSESPTTEPSESPTASPSAESPTPEESETPSPSPSTSPSPSPSPSVSPSPEPEPS